MKKSQKKDSFIRKCPVNANYLRTWLSRMEIRMIRQGGNPTGIRLSQRQVYNIIEGRSKNFLFRKYLVEVARENERMHGFTDTSSIHPHGIGVQD